MRSGDTMTRKEPKVMGFYKEEGDDLLIGELKGDQDGLYLELPSGFRNRMEVVVGNKVRVLLDSVIDKNGQVLREINKEVMGEIIGYWNELHIPRQEIFQYGLKKGDGLKLIVKSVIQHGVERMA